MIGSNHFLPWLAENYQWRESLAVLIGVIALTVISNGLLRFVPAYQEAAALNKTAYEKKMQRKSYAANLRTATRWAVLFYAIIFAGVMPLITSPVLNSWWRVAVDAFAFLMVYDFFYYFVHRYVFHDNNGLKGVFTWVHAVHHRQHNTCRADSNYIHPIETALGLGLFTSVLALYAIIVGKPDVMAMTLGWVLYIEMNLHNHGHWKADHFPFRTLNYLSVMHHNHHETYNDGNFGSITMFFDWLFGTLDYGKSKKEIHLFKRHPQ